MRRVTEDRAEPLAERLYAADQTVGIVEDELLELIQSTTVTDQWEDWSRDHYDSSLELYGVVPDARLSVESQKKFEAAGFSIVWLNHSDGWETTYSLHRGTEHRAQKSVKKCARVRQTLAASRLSTRREVATEIADWLESDLPLEISEPADAAKLIREKYGVGAASLEKPE